MSLLATILIGIPVIVIVFVGIDLSIFLTGRFSERLSDARVRRRRKRGLSDYPDPALEAICAEHLPAQAHKFR